jgi:hypothetical protein
MNHRMQGLGCWMWVMIGLWLGFAPLTSMARMDIRVTQSGSQVKMTLTGSVNTTNVKFDGIGGLKANYSADAKRVLVGSGNEGRIYQVPNLTIAPAFGRSTPGKAGASSVRAPGQAFTTGPA